MVKYKTSDLSVVFASLADPTRRGILQRVAKRPLTVSEIARPYKMSLPAISKHLRVLESAHLIERQRQGRRRIVRLNPGPLKTIAQYIAQYRKHWEGQLDRLESYLQTESKEGG